MTPRRPTSETRRPSKVARWTALLHALLLRRSPVTLDDLMREVPGYQMPPETQRLDESDARWKRAFESVRRKFERDKDDLKALGIPLETIAFDVNQHGYRLRREAFFRPYLTLLGQVPSPRVPRHAVVETVNPDALEMLLAAATRVAALGDPRLAEAARRAVRTLAHDLPVDTLLREHEDDRAATPHAKADLLALLDAAAGARQRVSVAYRAPHEVEARLRELEPFGLFLLGQHWYLAARDAGTDGPVKNFRVSRITSAETIGDAKAFSRPADFRLAEHARSRQAWELGDRDLLEAVIRFAPDGGGAVQAAARLGEPVPGEPELRRFRVRRRETFVRWLLSLAPHIRVLEPADLRDELRAAADAVRAHHLGGAA